MLNLAGQRFGKLIALHISSRSRGYIMWACKCDCGIEKEYRSSHLKANAIKSCGNCEPHFIVTHGMSRSERKNFYQVWQGIKTRCYNKNSYPYKD